MSDIWPGGHTWHGNEQLLPRQRDRIKNKCKGSWRPGELNKDILGKKCNGKCYNDGRKTLDGWIKFF